ncbi:MAG: DUF4105 domain-containing protein [Saprospiraceae bacterium]
MRNYIFIILFLISWQISFAQVNDLDNDITISLITGSPGDELYSVFGHSAIRVRDDRTEQDILYNYGTFDFDTPNFYWKFMRGKLPYMLSVDRTEDLFRYYVREGRSITEQTLNLTNAQEEKLLQFLAWNYKPENRAYMYDFFYNNCATVIRDLFEKEYGIDYQVDSVKEITFRQLLDEKMPHLQWTNFGMDLILGAPADKKADFRNQMFLPEYLAQHLVQATLPNGEPLIQNQHTKTLVQKMPVSTAEAVINFNPTLFFVIVAMLALVLTFTGSERMKHIFDVTLFTVLGLGGLFLLFMWFGTDHVTTKNNWNLLWMNPLCLLLAIGIVQGKNPKWLRIGFAIYATILWLLLLTWNWIPQQFNIAIIPILIALIIRSMDREGVVMELIKKVTSHKPQAAS